MIYQIEKPLMVVGYLILISLGFAIHSPGAFSAPGDALPAGQLNATTSAIKTSPVTAVTTSVINSNLSETPTNIDAAQAIPSISESPQATPAISESPQALEPAIAAPANDSAIKQKTKKIEIPNDVISMKPIKGLNLPAQMQRKIVPTSQSSDVRVIIDISGSMTENDQSNIRIPALNLIVEMLPDGAQAGVWTFGQWVNMLIPPAKVNEAWRVNAREQAKKINSHGLRTNIGEAMEKAIWKFEKDSKYDQHVILLTDGLVDIAKDSDPKQQQKNETERQRIMTQVLKQYQELGVKIHSIALSDKADKALLERLALETNGSSVVVNNSDDLVKAFLKAFEKAAPETAEQVPLSEDNTFEIDESIQEFTALVFRKEGSVPTQLISPSGKVVSQIKGSDNAKWFSESVYDLVTLKTPEAGKWKIEADLDPDNRVTVVSDLKMEIANLPTTLFPGQQVDFEVYLHENGEVITNPDFLKLMTIEMTMTAESGRSGTKNISDPNNIPESGRFQESIKRLEKEGQYELKVNIDGKTFKRMRKEYIQVRQPIGFEIRKRIVNGNEAYAVRVVPQVPDIEVARTRVIAKIKGPDSTSIIQAMPWVEEGVWETIIEPTKGLGEYNIAMNVKGRFAEDQEFRIKPDTITLTFPIPVDFTHKYYVKDENEEVLAQNTLETDELENAIPDLGAKLDEQVAQTEKDTAEPAVPEVSEENPVEESPIEGEVDTTAEEDESTGIPSWVFILIPVLTILFGVGGFLVYRMMAKKKASSSQSSDKSDSQDSEMKGPEVSLNDGMDDEDFDEDFDLSDSDDDEELLAAGGDLDDLDGLDLSNDDDIDDLDSLDDLDDIPDLDEDIPVLDETGEEVKDEIPDFDENFDIDADAPEIEKPPEVDSPEDTAAALDELDSVLDDLGLDDEVSGVDSKPADDGLNDSPDIELEGEAAVDAALANLESELDDLDLGDEKV